MLIPRTCTRASSARSEVLQYSFLFRLAPCLPLHLHLNLLKIARTAIKYDAQQRKDPDSMSPASTSRHLSAKWIPLTSVDFCFESKQS